ncbi:MAG: RelA/SpoT family protein, partial [Actinomycetales bacterium]|nr:RelA/SpoT family protein [Actinomycetales bacterium]
MSSNLTSAALAEEVANHVGAAWSTPANLTAVIDSLLAYHPSSKTENIIKAYKYADFFHREQNRRSGEPYITHPVAVAGILADLGMTEPTIVAALLHDTIEDTVYSLSELEQDFGAEVAGLVDGVTKLDRVKFGHASAAETVRKMVVAMARDIRVLVIKLSDRLHNMRTLGYLPAEKQEQKARETLEIYAPLAHRLGMNAIKWELEDLSFATLYPKMYDEIVRLVSQQAPARNEYLNTVISEVSVDLKEAGLEAEVSGRPKHYYSVYQKMIVRGRDFQDIYDLNGVRILVDSVQDCYATLGIIHNHWNPVPGRFKDYIAMPKFTMYQSLHTTVIGPAGKPVEFQIRTHEMHRAAEYGVASHWRYKQAQVAGKSGPDDLGWVRQLLDWQRETEDPGDFLDSLRNDLGVSEVYVFTPKGEVLALPKGSTPIDFAYSVHTEVGNRCVGARV